MENIIDCTRGAGQNINQAAAGDQHDTQQTSLQAHISDVFSGTHRGMGENFEDNDEPSPAMEGEAEDFDMEDSGLDNELVRQEAWAICRVRELAKACARLSGRLLPMAIEGAARRIGRCAFRIGGFPPEPEPLTSLEVTALQVALQEAAAATAFPHGGEPTREGVAAVELLAQQALEGIDLSRPAEGGLGASGLAEATGAGGSEEGISVELLVRVGPERVSALSSGFACLLRRTLCPCNCFAVLLLARRLDYSALAEEALLACIANFPLAVRADKRHFLMLDESLLLLITSNSNLQVLEELDVWQAIAEWVQHSLESRRGHLYDLLHAGVRLSHLDTLQLSQLQRHPLLVAEPGPASQLVSAAYSARILSNVHQSRNRQRGGSGASGEIGPGLQAHPGDPLGLPAPQQSLQYTRPVLLQQQQPVIHHQQQQQQPERTRPHAALQQLIGSLQARAAAAKAKQQQQQILLQQQQKHQQQKQETGGVDVGQERSGQAGVSSSNAPSCNPLPPVEGTPPVVSAAAATEAAVQVKQEPETSSGTSDGHISGQQLLPQRRPSTGSLPSLQVGTEGGGIGRGSATVTTGKRQLASMLAQAIAKAAAKQGLPRIQVGAGGQITPGAVQAALNAAQKQMAANPQLQEMLREAKAQMSQPQLTHQQGEHAVAAAGHSTDPHQTHQGQHAQQQQQPIQQQNTSQPHHYDQSRCLTTVGISPSDSSVKPSLLPTNSFGASAASSSPRVISPGLASQLMLLPGSQPASQQPGQQEPVRPSSSQSVALAPQQLLQIAAAVQKAVRSGQPQPPHVRQQLEQLQAFISRQLAATPPGSSQQPLLLALQSMLAGAASGTDMSPQAHQLSNSTLQPGSYLEQPLSQQRQTAEPQPHSAEAGVPVHMSKPQTQTLQQQEGALHAERSGTQRQEAAQGQSRVDSREDAAPSDGGRQLSGLGETRIKDAEGGGEATGFAGHCRESVAREPNPKRQRQE